MVVDAEVSAMVDTVTTQDNRCVHKYFDVFVFVLVLLVVFVVFAVVVRR